LENLEGGAPIRREDYADYDTDYVHIVPRNIQEGDFVQRDLIFLKEPKGEELRDFRVSEGEILLVISSNCGQAFCFDLDRLPPYLRDKKFTCSHYIVKLKPKSEVNPKLLAYLLNSMKPYFRAVETGKTQKNLPLYYVNGCPVSKHIILNQQMLLAPIEAAESRIMEAKSKIRPIRDVVDEVFSSRFGYSISEYRKRGKQSTFGLGFSELTRSRHLRVSTKSHHPKYAYLSRILASHRAVKLKRLILEPTTLGKSPEYDSEGEAAYISPDVIKDWHVDFENAKKLSDRFYRRYKHAFGPQKGDIIMVRSSASSMAIGKVALFEYDSEECPSIISDFTMRIRPNPDKVDPKYLYFYFISFLFRELIDLEKKGMDIMNVFPSQIETLPIIRPSPEEQRRIVGELELEAEEQRRVEEELSGLRVRIDGLLEENKYQP
jgi:type I restriction enzyme S subunit